MANLKSRLAIQVLICVALIYGALFPFVGPDLHNFYFPWLEQIRAEGFSRPIGNYSPPYLYLLWLTSGLSNVVAIKLVAIAGCGLLALAVRDCMRSFELEGADEAGLIALLIPTVIFNGPFIGQVDTYWVACCLMCVSHRNNAYAAAFWAGLGFAFKAQALFIAPFALAIVVQKRKWLGLIIPLAVYAFAMSPAWVGGWPLDDLLSIYVKQYQYFPWLSTAPNVWAIPSLFDFSASEIELTLGFVLALIAVAFYWRRFPDDYLRAALLSAIIVPFFLPKMHERYFLLADVLAFCLSYRDRRPAIFVLVVGGSSLSCAAYATALRPLNAAGSLLMGAALVLLARGELSRESRIRNSV